jgi:hypothetical protein
MVYYEFNYKTNELPVQLKTKSIFLSTYFIISDGVKYKFYVPVEVFRLNYLKV